MTDVCPVPACLKPAHEKTGFCTRRSHTTGQPTDSAGTHSVTGYAWTGGFNFGDDGDTDTDDTDETPHLTIIDDDGDRFDSQSELMSLTDGDPIVTVHVPARAWPDALAGVSTGTMEGWQAVYTDDDGELSAGRIAAVTSNTIEIDTRW